MSTATKLAIVDKLLPLLEAFGASRARQSAIRKEMKASRCAHPDAWQIEEGDDGAQFNVLRFPCYHATLGRSPWCEACRQHDNAFSRLLAERKANKKRLSTIERLAVAYAKPEPEVPAEPKELLDLIHKLQQEAEGGEAVDVRSGDHEGAHH